MEVQFEIGDVVVLKSGGPPMTIQDIGDYTGSGSFNPGVSCVWFEGTKKVDEIFDPRTVQRYRSDG